MALSKQPYKGARDFYPPDKRLQKYIFAKWREVCESFGYEEYDAPILEPLEIYLAKTGEEIVKEQTYLFQDRSGREVVIRPEMTPTVSRMVAAKRQELSYPLRWYSIPNLWRYERPQRGRLREHWQLNVDLFGVEGMEAEYEVISLVDALFKSFGAKPDMYEIRLNSRKLVDDALAGYLSLDGKEAHGVSKLIDKLHKMDRAKFVSAVDKVLKPKSREAGITEKLLALLDVRKIKELPGELKDHPSAAELAQMLNTLSDAGIKNARFDVTLMRGFDYYTDVVFEVFDTHPDNNRSMLGGGRFDGLVGLFGVQPVPTVGFGWGDVTLTNFLELHSLMPDLPPETDIYAAVVGDVVDQARKPIASLRRGGVNVAVDLSGRKVGDQIRAADKKGVRYVLVVGEEELKSGKLTLKDLDTGKEQKLSPSEIIKKFKE
ncbi:MAG TPA: histidine--tRNA ligase [Candidatus Saccharimonadales bacterium]|nr:histidine--tRNA ligase [Candidatus Saccharimonadales bacterium]